MAACLEASENTIEMNEEGSGKVSIFLSGAFAKQLHYGLSS